MVRENHVRTEELIYPLFVMEGENIVQPVESMPGICQYSVDRMNEELDRVKALQIPAILIFGIPEHKDEVGSGAYDEHGIVQTAIRRIETEADDMNRRASPLDRYLDTRDKSHAGLLGRLAGARQTAEIVVIGQCPEVDRVGRRPPRHVLRRQQAVGNDRVAMEIEIGWRHGLRMLDKTAVYHEGRRRPPRLALHPDP